MDYDTTNKDDNDDAQQGNYLYHPLTPLCGRFPEL